ncbi:MAG: ROK family transcriptional regulator [Spirochaetales bacterium]|nr:ROK family transcriptional regulator [Spirochaetales bacterium]
MKNITVSDIKKNNLSLIYKLIYLSGKNSKQEIAAQLNLSLPTVSEKLRKLEHQGLITKEGYFESSVGRRAVAYTICSDARLSLGVGLYSNQIRIISTNLKGEICATSRYDLDFEDRDEYYKEVSYKIKDFILENNYLTDQILGIGFAIQGLTSVDGRKITFGKTLGYTDLSIDVFSRYLSYPCSFFHDAKCAANTELWFNKDITNALYLSIGNHLGGAMIVGGQIMMGENGHCGTAEHMQLIPEGRPCYCGARGCIESYCSLNALLDSGETIDRFFQELKNDSPSHMKKWDEYLEMLARAVNNLYILLDRHIILGGEISHYLRDEDLEKLIELTKAKAVFTDSTPFIQISSYPKDSVSVGASLYYTQEFINQI